MTMPPSPPPPPPPTNTREVNDSEIATRAAQTRSVACVQRRSTQLRGRKGCLNLTLEFIVYCHQWVKGQLQIEAIVRLSQCWADIFEFANYFLFSL